MQLRFLGHDSRVPSLGARSQINNNQVDYKQYSQSQKLTTVNSVEKQPSKIRLLILFMVTIALYAFSISELSKIFTEILEPAVQEAIQDYHPTMIRVPKL